MSVFKYFKNIPLSPPIGRQALSVIFLFKFAMRSLGKKIVTEANRNKKKIRNEVPGTKTIWTKKIYT